VRELSRRDAPAPLELRPEPEGDPLFTSSMSRDAFEAAVERIQDYIRAGDAFQVVLSQRLGMTLDARPFDLYRAIRSLNPSPYLYFLELDGVTLVGSSPEVLVRVEDDVVTVRPIAGTRPRGRTPDEDRALADELAADEKELAEHRMLVDLGRNDVGRVARFGSIRVPELMVVERYSHVMHLVSQVEGELEHGRSVLDVLRACFPAGTVSGAPKVRAMEIISELEPVGRGPYAGAVGYLGYGCERMDLAITIRTVLVTGGRAWVQAGAGIVADSVPALEYEETLNKARALLRAAAMLPAAATPPEHTLDAGLDAGRDPAPDASPDAATDQGRSASASSS
jgi:anthranilate synthase component 1